MNKKHLYLCLLALVAVWTAASSQQLVVAQGKTDNPTFQDTTYGYQFAYPLALRFIQQWDTGLNHIVEFNDTTTYSTPLKLYVVIGNFEPKYATLDDWIETQEDDHFGKKIATRSVDLDGASGVEHVYQNEYGFGIAQYYLRNGKTYLFNLGPLPSTIVPVQFDMIIKSFTWLPGNYPQRVPTLPTSEHSPVLAPNSPASAVLLQFPFCGSFVITQGYNQGSHQGQYNAYALDWSLGYGGPVYAAHPGTVTTKWDSTGGGNLLKIETQVSGTQYQTWYAHLLSFAVASGSQVYTGDLVGYADSTGTASTGNHLHFALLQNISGGYWSILPEPVSGENGFANGQTHTRYCPPSDTTPPSIAITQQPTIQTWYNTDQPVAFTVSDAGSGPRGYRVAWDQNPPGGSEIAGSSGSVSLSSPGQGQHTLYIQAWDNAGNMSGVTSVGWLGYDTVAPNNPNSINPGCTATSGTWQNTCADANFTWSGASDATSGIAGYQIYWGNDPNGTATTWSTFGSYNPSAVNSGTYYLRVRTEDYAGNWSAWATIYVLRYDGTAPTGSLQINANASTTYATLVKLQPAAVDAASGVCQARYRDAGGMWTDWQSFTPSTYWQLPGPTGQTFTVETQVKDCAGNVSAVYSDAITLNIYPTWPASNSYHIVKSTIGAAGLSGSSTNYRLNSTLGQPSMIGQMASANYGIASGYWATQYTNYAVFLPLILR